MPKKFNPADPKNRLPITLIHAPARKFLPQLLFGDGQTHRVPAPKRALHYHPECILRSDKIHDRYSQVHIPAFMMKDGKPRKFLSSRLAYYLAYGKDPGEKYVCHRCDRPKCINGAHLFLATAAENNADAREKGRRPGGSVATRQLKLALIRSLVAQGYFKKHALEILGVGWNSYRIMKQEQSQ